MSDHQQPSPDSEGRGPGQNNKQGNEEQHHDDYNYREKHQFQSNLQEDSTSSQRTTINESRRTEHHQVFNQPGQYLKAHL